MSRQQGVVIFVDKLFVDEEPIVPLIGMCFDATIDIDALGTWLGSYLYKQSRGLKYKSSTPWVTLGDVKVTTVCGKLNSRKVRRHSDGKLNTSKMHTLIVHLLVNPPRKLLRHHWRSLFCLKL
jgi:hypothetical protein